MQTRAPNLVKPKRCKTTHIRRWFSDLWEHFRTSNVKIRGTVCKLYQFWTFFVVKSLKHKMFDIFEKKFLVGMSWTQCNLKAQNRLKAFGNINKNGEKFGKNWVFAGIQGFISSQNDLAGLHFSSQDVIWAPYDWNRRESLELPGELAWNDPSVDIAISLFTPKRGRVIPCGCF